MMITARFVKKMAIFSRVTPAPERTTPTACTPLSELPTGPCGCAPSARRKYVTTHFNNSGTVRKMCSSSVYVLKVLNKENLTWPQNFIQSYVTHKTGELAIPSGFVRVV